MTVTEILQSAGYPTDTLVLDFETFYSTEYTLSGKNELSIVEYVADPRFEFTGLGIKFNKDDSVFIPGPGVPWAIERLWKKWGEGLERVTVVTANSKFDCLILAEKFGIYPKYSIDIEDLSRYYDARMSQSLKNLCKLFKLKDKGDTSQFKGQHWHEMDQAAMREYCLNDVELEYQLLELLLPIIDNPEFEFKLMQHTLNLYLKPPFDLDVTMAKEISAGMQKELRADLLKVYWVLKYATKKKRTISEVLRARSILPVILGDLLAPYDEKVPMKAGKKKMIPALAQEDVPFQLLSVHRDEKVRDLMAAKAAVTSWPLHRSKVESIISQAACSGDTARVPIKYYGAHTGRWSGTQKVNLLNLGGKGRGRAIHPLIGKVRNALVAPDGYKLVIADSAQIEARELAWVAGQNDLTEGFAGGQDIYSTFATRLFGTEVRKPREDDDKESVKLLSIRRGFGKDAILGCGYGMGTTTFLLKCKQNPSLRPLFDSGEYDAEFIDGLIKTYRKTYAHIPKFWRNIEKCFRWVTKYPNEVQEYYIDAEFFKYNGIDVHSRSSFDPLLRFWKEGKDTIIQLPSGRRLFYRNTVVTRDKKLKYLAGRQTGYLWGGSITENVIQSMCRDLLSGWLLECERNEIPIIHHTYDELVGCVPEHRADAALEQMIEIMNTGPDWAAGLPLATEGEISKCFKK